MRKITGYCYSSDSINLKKLTVDLLSIYWGEEQNYLPVVPCLFRNEEEKDPKTGRFINTKNLRKLEELQKEKEAARNQKAEQLPIQATQNYIGARIIDLSYVCNQLVESCISCKSTLSLADYGSETMVWLAGIFYMFRNDGLACKHFYM